MPTHTLGELEQVIMEVLWRKRSATVREVHDALSKRRDLAYTTVMTVMTRLCDKKMLCRASQADGSFLYKPCLSREDFSARTSRTICAQLLKNFGAIAVAQFVDALEQVDPKQLEILRAKLKKK